MNSAVTKVAVVIPVFNRREITLKGLRSLSAVDKSGLEVRIFIVDDGSTDGTSDAIAAEFPDVMLLAGTGSLHYAGGTNRGMEEALKWDPGFVAIMNDDAVFHDQFLQRLIATANSNSRSIVGALLLLWNEPHKVFQVGQKWRTLRGGWQMPETLTAFSVPQEPFDVECVVGNCVLIPVGAIRECGLMDANGFPHGWGDAQYFVRIRKAGWRLLVDPKAFVWCEPNTYPPPLHQLPLNKIVRTLFVDRRHPLNLQRQLVARVESAPTKAAGYIAFGVYCIQLASKTIRFGIGRLYRH